MRTNQIVYMDVRNGYRVEMSEMRDGRVYFHSQGGGFIHSVTRADWDKHFKPAPEPKFTTGAVSGEWLADGQSFACYLDGSKWNGWAMPYFTKEQADAYLAATPDGMTGSFDEARNVYVFTCEGEEPYEVEAEVIDADGQHVTVYPIGAGYWVWDEVRESVPAKDRQQGEG